MPSRRSVLRGAGGALAVVAGCVSAPAKSDTEPADSTTTDAARTTTDPVTTTETTTKAESTTTEATTTDRYQTKTAPRNRVRIEATGGLTLTVTKYRSEAAEREQASKTYHLADGEEVRVTSFDPAGYLVFTLDGEVVWAGEIGPDGSYQFTVSPGGDVDLTYSIR
jgi:FtsP/CotA-like multicopper oxidase with cupredoxin domain